MFLLIASVTAALCLSNTCVAEKLSLDAATAAAVPGVDTHKERGGEIIPHLDSQAVSDRSAVLCPSHGRNDRITPVYSCLFSTNRSYTVCYYAALYHHICLQNVIYHDLKDDDDARQHHVKEHSVAAAENLSTDRASAEHDDITKKADLMNVNKSIPLRSHKTSMPATDAEAATDNVPADESVSATAAVGKTSNTSTTANMTQKSSRTKKNVKATAAKRTAGETKATSKTNSTTASGNSRTPAPVNKTTKLTYKDLVKSITSSTGNKLSNSEKSNVDAESNTNNSNCVNQRAVATEATPTDVHRSQRHTDRLSPDNGRLSPANRSHILCYYAAMFRHICLQNVCYHDIKDDYARPHFRKHRSAAEAQMLAADRTSAGHEDITKKTDSNKINKTIPLSSHETSMPSTDAHDVTDNVLADENVSSAATTVEVSNISTTANRTQQSTATKRNEKVTTKTVAVETEATTKTNATTTNGNNTTSAPVNQTTETKLTYEHLAKLTTSSICSKFSNSKKPKAGHKSSTSSGNGTNQRAVATDPTPTILHSSPVDGGLFSANRSYTLRYYAAMFHHVCLQNAWHHDVKDDDDARQNLLKLRSVAEAETSAANRSFATHEDATKQLDSMKMDRSIPLNNHKISMPVTNTDVTDYISLACESVAATSIASKTSTSSATANTVQKSPATKNSGKATAIKTTAGEIETTTKTEATTTNGSFPIPSPVSKMSATKQTSEVRVKSMSSAGSKRRNWQPDVDAKSHTSTTNNISQREVAKNQKPSTSGIGSFVSPSDSSVVSGKPTVKELDLLKRNEIWLTDNAESLAKYGTVEVKSKDQRQRVGSTAEDGEEADAEKYATLVENDGTANRRTSRHDVDDQCDQQLRMRSLGTKLLQLENQLLQSAVDRASDVTVTVKLENYIMRLERELMESNHNFVEMKRENEELRQKNLEAAAATNDGDQHRKVDALTSIINNQSISLVALQDKYTGLERENRQLVERILNQSLTINKMMLRVETLDQCVQQQRSTETKLLQLENQLLQTAVDRASDMTTTVDLKNHVMRLQRELVGLNENLIEVKTENEQLRQRNLEAAAATNEGDQQRKVDELADIVHNQSSSLDTLQDKYSALERDSRLLVERILNQSLVMNEMMLRVDMMAREQTKQTTELKQRGSDSWTTVAVSHDYANPPIYKTRDGDTPKDCYAYYERGQTEDSVLTVRHNDVDVSVFCDMTDGGWTVIQRRLNGSVDFYRSWKDYKHGFGSIAGEHWLGNDVIHLLTNEDHYSLRVSLTDWNDWTHHVDYKHFRVSDEVDGYRLYVVGYLEQPLSGGAVAGDSLLKHNGCRFSTFDVDNDLVDGEFEHGSCARRFTGAWWYYRCYMSNLNGRYYSSGTVPERQFDGVAWKSWTGSQYSLKRVEMKIRPARVHRH